jgi:hypothetical protein
METLKEPWLSGIFNNTFLGIPYWGYLAGAIILLIIFAELLLWWFYKKPFEPLWGLYDAMWDGVNAVFIGNESNHFDLVAENRAKLIHPHSEYLQLYDQFFEERYPRPSKLIPNIEKIKRTSRIGKLLFGHNYDMTVARTLELGITDVPIVAAGGTPLEIVYDLDNWTSLNHPEKYKEIYRLVEMYNESHPEDEIFSYEKFCRYCNNGNIDYRNTSLRPKYTVPWNRIKAMFPHDIDNALFEGTNRQRAADMENAEKGDQKTLAYVILGLGFAAFLLMILLRVIHLIGPK